MKRVFIIALVTAIILGITLPMAAEPIKIGTEKLKRGGKNIVLGWTEVPDAIIRVTKDTNNPFLGITVGLVKGILNAFANEVHIKKHKFHPYVWEIANMVREGVMEREDGYNKIYQKQSNHLVEIAKKKFRVKNMKNGKEEFLSESNVLKV